MIEDRQKAPLIKGLREYRKLFPGLNPICTPDLPSEESCELLRHLLPAEQLRCCKIEQRYNTIQEADKTKELLKPVLKNHFP
jgi:hypothetical protein